MKKLLITICCAVAFSGCTCEEQKEPATEPEAKPVPAVTKVTPKNLKINPKQLKLSLEALEQYKKELAKKQAEGQAALEASGTDAKLPEGSDGVSAKAEAKDDAQGHEADQADKKDAQGKQ